MNVEIAERLAARRRQAGLSQEALAAQLGVSRQAVSKWERSESSPDTDNLIALAQLYGVSLDELLYVGDDIKDDVTFEAADRAAERATGEAGPQAAAPAAAAGSSAAAQTPGATDSATEAATAPAGAAPDAEESQPASASDPAKQKVHIGFDGIHVLDGDDYVHVSWRDGVHVKESKKGDEVHVGWDGIHVKEGSREERRADRAAERQERRAREHAQGHEWASAEGIGDNEVIIDGDGVVINGEHFDDWRDAHDRYGYGHIHEGRWDEPCGYTVCGERFDTLEAARAKYGPEVGKSIPVRKHYLRAFEKSWVKFPYPLIVILAYLLIGIFQDAWGLGLFLFFTIPLYYMVGHAIGRQRLAPLVAGAYPILVTAWFFYMAFVENAWHPAWVSFLTIPLVEWLVHSLSRWWRRRKRAKDAAAAAPIEVEAEAEAVGNNPSSTGQ
ncbi:MULTISPECIES: helix-turn-helix domain-containing protein [Gordonibacter]|uniref:Helix-turn-helix transcriptional regulator n=1 Tax=Gordonibacter faecis TaxID=3047475 RepID=A0ABT7DJJ8_9ACTN|nr:MULTISPECIES: helix-turn-helix transcriptional regulator [unclassified Gordonibacter]MDJ1649693.1 helix-turn-helix transcriptional regulator [Gordonibacter sp. KGMB12511]HIW76496.1 helix-turn-helix domain-containing protein [Candidatus Gordonibacter avicola]